MLEELVIDRVDLVDEGANSAAFVELFKRKEHKKVDETIVAKVVSSPIVQKSTEPTQTPEARPAADQDAIIAELQKQLADVTKERDELKKQLTPKEPVISEEEIMKNMPEAAKELFLKMKLQKEAAELAVAKMKEAEQHAEAVRKAAELKALPIEHDKLVNILKSADADVVALLTSAAAAIEAATLSEIGKSVEGSLSGSADAWDRIEAKAEELMKSAKITKAKAITQIIEENPDLYKEYLQGGAN
jgi:hypothetical protein